MPASSPSTQAGSLLRSAFPRIEKFTGVPHSGQLEVTAGVERFHVHKMIRFNLHPVRAYHGGNKYRIVAHVDYLRQTVKIQAVMDHAEYDKDLWKKLF